MHQSTTGSSTLQFSTLTIQNRKLIWRCTSLLERCIEAVLQRKQWLISNVYKFKSYLSWQYGLYTGQDSTLEFNHVLSLSTYRGVPSMAKGQLLWISLGWQMTFLQLLCSILVTYDIITIILKFMFTPKFPRWALGISRFDLPSSFSSLLRITVFICFCWWFSLPRDMIPKKE